MSDSVLIGGVFDPLHAGHLAYIREAQTWGHPVDCALSDAPQKHPPLVPIAQRAALLTALGVRDVYAHAGPQDLPDMIRALKPRTYIKGHEWQGLLPEDQVKACYDAGAVIVYVHTKQQSSSAMLANYERKRNAEKLAAFEAFVQGQQPATKPWEPATDYSWEARKEVEAPHARLILDVFRPSRLLDVGCGPGHLLRLLREEQPTWPHCFDGIDKPNYDIADDETLPYAVRAWDLVICREVLEHLTVRQLAVAVRNLVKLSSKYVYVTTRFTAKPHLLDVDGSDMLDPTHITLLSQDFLRALFVIEGCRRRADLEARLDWKQLGRVLVYEVPK